MQGFPTLEFLQRLPGFTTFEQYRQAASNIVSGGVGFILVHFPHVRITNEYDRYTDINHLFAKIPITLDGTMQNRFYLNRSEYSMLHISNGYMHSHVSAIPFDNFTQFQSCCTGSGPINSTMCSLVKEFDESIWRLFCLELDKYTQVESIAGTPYHRLESLRPGGGRIYKLFTETAPCSKLSQYDLGRYTNGHWELPITFPELAEFTKYLIDHEVFKFSYNSGGYTIAMSNVDLYIRVSNAFIKWFNNKFNRGETQVSYGELIASHILTPCVYSNGELYAYTTGRSPRDYQNCVGKKVCTFKGRDVLLNITDDASVDEGNEVHILKPKIILYLVTKILNIVNFRYGNEGNSDADADADASTSHKKVVFL